MYVPSLVFLFLFLFFILEKETKQRKKRKCADHAGPCGARGYATRGNDRPSWCIEIVKQVSVRVFPGKSYLTL
jgi:hypothetical protein